MFLIIIIIIIMRVKNDHRSEFSNFKQLERRSLKKIVIIIMIIIIIIIIIVKTRRKEYTRFIVFLYAIHSRAVRFFWKQTIGASYRRKTAIYADGCLPCRHTETVRVIWDRVPGQPDPLTLEHGYEIAWLTNTSFQVKPKVHRLYYRGKE